jgi:hypothetical protein
MIQEDTKDEELELSPAEQRILIAAYAQIKAMRGNTQVKAIKQKEKKLNGGKISGQEINISRDQSIVEAIAKGMQEFPRNQEAGARLAHISKQGYTFVRKLLILRDRPTLAKADRDMVNHCLQIVEVERRIAPAKHAAGDLIARCWIQKKDPGYKMNAIRRRFEQTVTTIRESCAATTDMKLPADLTKDNAAETIGSLSASIELIAGLIRKLVGDITEE